MKQILSKFLLTFMLIGLCSVGINAQTVNVSGELKKWHKITTTLTLPSNLSEADATFRDNRMDVIFTAPSGKKLRVPGFFAADGNAANTSAKSGNKYKAFLRPDETGNWTYQVLFYTGTDVATKEVNQLPSPTHTLNGTVGNVGASTAVLPDLKAKGRLYYQTSGDLNARRYLRFAETGEYFLKHGPDSPENFLDYNQFDFDDSRNGCTLCVLHYYSAHQNDYKAGDPTWASGKGKNIIGAINYLKQIEVNSLSMSLFGGDDKNVFPWVKVNNKFQYDISKLEQWEVVLDHAEKNGLVLHLKLAEAENWYALNSTQIKVYYREMVARFGHHLGVEFNFSEEYASRDLTYNSVNTAYERIDWLKSIDPWGSNHVFHTRPETSAKAAYDKLIEDGKYVTGASMQNENGNNYAEIFELTNHLVTKSKDKGFPWVVASDEQASANNGVFTTMDQGNGTVSEQGRKGVLWGNIMAGGGGVMWYGGANGDFKTEDFRRYNTLAQWGRNVVSFFQDNGIKFWLTQNNDALVSNANAHCLANAGSEYIIYLKDGGTTNLNLNNVSGTFTVKWFDPRNGGALQNGSVTSVTGGGNRAIGNAPNNTNQDWAVLVTNTVMKPVQSITLDSSSEELTNAGDKFTLTPRILPTDANNQNVNWTSSKPAVATVDNGVVTAVGAGETIITVTTVDGGKTATCVVTVASAPVTGVRLDKTSVETYVGKTVNLTATVLPTNAGNTNVTWESSNTNVATVTNGVIAAKSAGTTTITVKTAEGNKTATCSVIVQAGSNDGVTYGENWIVFEADATTSNLDKWVIRKPGDAKYNGGTDLAPINDDYIEFTGNNPDGGSAMSPLEYTFTCPKTGTYRLGMRLLQNLEGAAWDKCNDVYIRMDGDFTSGNVFSIDDLKTDHKFYGRGKDVWGAGVQMEGHVNGVKKLVPAIYNFKAGETYTFTVSGRAQRTCIDYIIFYETSINYSIGESIDIATANDPKYRPGASAPQTCNKILSKDFTTISGITGYDNATKAAIPNSPAGAVNVGMTVLGCGGTNGLNRPCAAEQIYSGAAMNATFIVNAMGEPDGECTYEVFVNGTKVGSAKNTRIYGTNTPAYTIEPLTINTTPVAIASGDKIRVTFNQTSNQLVPENGGFATARGRWESIEICSSGGVIPVDVTGITDLPATETVGTSEKVTLSAAVEPSNASNKSIIWTSSNTSIATVNNGVVTGVSVGTATITATTVDGGFETSCKVTVTRSLNVTLSPIHDAYLQGTSPFNNNDLRVEAGKRTSYLMFDLSNVPGKIASATLTLAVGTDNGNGEVQVHLGTSNNWTETNLSSSNAPVKGALLGKLTGNYDLNKEYTFDLDGASIASGGKLSLVVTHVSGNDISFASKESGKAAVLTLNLPDDTPVNVNSSVSGKLEVSPNPFEDVLNVSSAAEIAQLVLCGMNGSILKTEVVKSTTATISTSELPAGMYILRVQDQFGAWLTQKVIKL